MIGRRSMPGAIANAVTNTNANTMTEAMTTIGARRGPRRARAGAAPGQRAPRGRRKRDGVPTKIDRLIEVANKLKEARTVGEACSDRALIYFIDMAIVHVCDSLRDGRQARDAAEPPLALACASF